MTPPSASSPFRNTAPIQQQQQQQQPQDPQNPQHLEHHHHHEHAPLHHFLSSTGTVTSSPNGIPCSRTIYGLLITMPLDEQTQQPVLQLEFVKDQNQPQIHPNSYAPADFQKVKKLGGGGSGVAVFEGTHPELDGCVMKHGSDKDLTELFALATVSRELQARGCAFSQQKAAEAIQQRIPSFQFIYISPHHLGEKRKALWKRLVQSFRYSNNSWLLHPLDEEGEEDFTEESSSFNHDNDSSQFTMEEDEEEEDEDEGAMGFDLLKRTSSSTAYKIMQLQRQKQNHKQQAQHQHAKTMHDLGGMPKYEEPQMPFGVAISKSGTVSGHRDISVVAARKPPYQRTPRCGVQLIGDSLTFVIPEDHYTIVNDNKQKAQPKQSNITKIQLTGIHGFTALKAIVDDLLMLMQEHKWKMTLGQRRIGGNQPLTGNQWLYSSKLQGKLLQNLITQKIRLVQDLAALTTPAEQNDAILQSVKQEVRMLEDEEGGYTIEASQLSDEADSFVGNSVRKNFQEDSGRFPVLMMMGKRFREHSTRKSGRRASGSMSSPYSSKRLAQQSSSTLILTPEEEIPAHHLGILTRPGAVMGDTFSDVPAEPCFLDSMNPFYWRNLLHFAIRPDRRLNRGSPTRHHSSSSTSHRTSDMALRRIWTCGMTDAGLHNLFVSADKLWLFDLGEPQLYSASGFLTKFLFSFFHTLGMQETDDGGWVRRFEVCNQSHKLNLTPETTKLLSSAYDAFEIALDRLIDELFNGDDSLRWLLIQYVTLQLFSDASFCLQKWTIKGGGRSRGENHQEGIEKWLWRALWDIYVAYDINSSGTWSRLKVEHPSASESLEMSPAIMKMIYSHSSTRRSSTHSELAMMDDLAIVDEEDADADNAENDNGFHLEMRREEPMINATS